MIAVVLILAAVGSADVAMSDWRWSAGVGYDAYVHGYYLADDDTTASLHEATVFLGLDARSAARATHQWFLRTEAATGTEVTRETIDASYRWRPGGREPRLRADLTWFGRQYRAGSDYDLVSDSQEGRLAARVVPWIGRGVALEARAFGRWLAYRAPSTLEQDFREGGGGLYLRAPSSRESRWEVGLRAARRAYPDSAAIDRDVLGADASANGLVGDLEYWGFHRSERRLIADDTARPSAWSHWTDANLSYRSWVADIASEVWRYDHEDVVYVDSWRLELAAGRRWGDPLLAQWQASLTAENLAAGDSPESYRQAGVRGGVESYLAPCNGSLAVELGRRWYAHPAAASDVDALLAYSDFTYLEVWLLATVHLAANLGLEVTASYEPERHTEQTDDIALGFASLRLVWRR